MLIPAGTRVLCEQGHHIATLAQDLWGGATADKAEQLTDWQIPIPAELMDADMPACPCCGSRWHIRDWAGRMRTPSGAVKDAFREYIHTEAGWFPPLVPTEA